MKASSISLVVLAMFVAKSAPAQAPTIYASATGEKLQVKSQKLVQDGPHIYPGALDDSKSPPRMILSIATQRLYIVKENQVVFDTPISSAMNGFRTPPGSFTIQQKIRTGKFSNLYKCPMPFWMRIGGTEFGLHEGLLPGHPASHGCVRLPRESAEFIFDHVNIGTAVDVVNSWSPQRAAFPQ